MGGLTAELREFLDGTASGCWRPSSRTAGRGSRSSTTRVTATAS